MYCLVPIMPRLRGMFPQRKIFPNRKQLEGEKLFGLRRGPSIRFMLPFITLFLPFTSKGYKQQVLVILFQSTTTRKICSKQSLFSQLTCGGYKQKRWEAQSCPVPIQILWFLEAALSLVHLILLLPGKHCLKPSWENEALISESTEGFGSVLLPLKWKLKLLLISKPSSPQVAHISVKLRIRGNSFSTFILFYSHICFANDNTVTYAHS